MTPPLRRRELLIGAGAALLVAAAGDPDAQVRAALDALDPSRPHAALAELARFDPARLSLPRRLDLLTVRRGLALDARLAALTPERRPGTAVRQAPHGDACFTLLLDRARGAPIAPEAAFAQLSRARDHYLHRADRLLRHFGFGGGSVGARFEAAFADPRWQFADSDAGRDAAVTLMTRHLARIGPRINQWLAPLPPECADVAVRRPTPAERAAGKAGFRTLPAPGHAGAYVIDLDRIADRPAFTLPAVVHHELLPGHMVQLAIEARAAPHPLRMRYAGGSSEGWAIHAELMAARHGAFADDPAAMLGHCHWMLFRFGRGLADLGFHWKGWSRDETRAHLAGWQGPAAYFAPTETELDRIAAEPASRAGEALVALHLAAHAPAGGAALRAFHMRVLTGGRKPLALIRTT